MDTESTQPGDSALSVDDAAQALMQRYESHADTPEETEAQAEVTAEEAEQVEAQAETETEDTEDATEEEAEARFETLNELAEATGMELDDFLKSIKATTKVQGEQSEVNLADLIKGYQLESDYTRKNEAFLKLKSEWESERALKQAELNAEFQKAGQAFRVAQQELMREFHGIDWEQLKANDPQQYLIQRQQFGERQASLDRNIQQATIEAQQVSRQQQAQMDAKKAEQLKQEDELLLAALPSWSDAETRKTESTKVGEYLAKSGFSPEEVAGVTDHRLIVLATKAMQSEKAAKQSDLAMKKVKKTPALVKPNARQNVNSAQQKVSALRKQVKKSGKVDDVAALLLARGN